MYGPYGYLGFQCQMHSRLITSWSIYMSTAWSRVSTIFRNPSLSLSRTQKSFQKPLKLKSLSRKPEAPTSEPQHSRP